MTSPKLIARQKGLQIPVAGLCTAPQIIKQIAAPQFIEITAVHTNFEQVVIATTEDKLRLAFNDHLRSLEQRHGWHTSLGIATATFLDFVIPKQIWQAIFVLATLGSFVWLLRDLYVAWRSPSVEDLICQLKK
jgi:hypothetical protein